MLFSVHIILGSFCTICIDLELLRILYIVYSIEANILCWFSHTTLLPVAQYS